MLHDVGDLTPVITRARALYPELAEAIGPELVDRARRPVSVTDRALRMNRRPTRVTGAPRPEARPSRARAAVAS